MPGPWCSHARKRICVSLSSLQRPRPRLNTNRKGVSKSLALNDSAFAEQATADRAETSSEKQTEPGSKLTLGLACKKLILYKGKIKSYDSCQLRNSRDLV